MEGRGWDLQKIAFFGIVERHGVLTIHVKDNARTIRRIEIDSGRKLADKLKPDDITKLFSVVGSLAWIARQGVQT